MRPELLFVALAIMLAMICVKGGEPVWTLLLRRRDNRRSLGWMSLGSGIAVGLLSIAAWSCGSPARAQSDPAGPTSERRSEEIGQPGVSAPRDTHSNASGSDSDRAARSKDGAPADQKPVDTGPGDTEPGDTKSPTPLRVPLESIDGAGAPIVMAKDRPDWIEDPPSMTGDVHHWPVKSDYHPRERDAERALDGEIVKAARAYVIEYLGSPQAPYFFTFDASTLKARFVRDARVYREVVESSVGTMHQLHAQLELPREFQKELEARWSQVVSATRLLRTLGVVVGVLAGISVLFAYFRLDTATRGYYTLRLKLLAVVAILAVAVLGVAYSRLSIVLVQWLL